MRILITRPLDDARPVAEALARRGIGAVVAPLMTIEPVAPAEPGALSLDGVQAILLTSANGARVLAAASGERGLPVFAVGDATAREARRQGFGEVHSAGGDVGDLARLAAERLDPAAGALFHPSGRDVAGDLKGLLEGRGFTVRREVLYRVDTAAELPEAARRALDEETVDGALFFSPRSARAFADLVLGLPAAGRCARLTAYCLSQAVAKAVGEVTWHSVKVADRPDLDHLLRLVDGDAAAGR